MTDGELDPRATTTSGPSSRWPTSAAACSRAALHVPRLGPDDVPRPAELQRRDLDRRACSSRPRWSAATATSATSTPNYVPNLTFHDTTVSFEKYVLAPIQERLSRDSLGRTMTTRQVAMVIDLNKCIGCQACTAACKSLWTDEPGQEYMLWNNVETKPGPGYPEGLGGEGQADRGWKDGALQYGGLHDDKDYGKPVAAQPRGRVLPGHRGAAAAHRADGVRPELERGQQLRRPTRTTTTSTCRACATTAPSRRASRPARCARSTSASRTASCWWTRTSARASGCATRPAPTTRCTSTT